MSDRVTPEAGAVQYFTADHRECDELWAAVEAAADAGDANATRAAFETFDKAMRRHFDMEEQVLFPAFEAATGMTMGPTRVMRGEHEQMRGLLSQMAAAGSNADALMDQGDTLLMFIQQHNLKEEGMLYPMADARLGATWSEVASRLARF